MRHPEPSIGEQAPSRCLPLSPLPPESARPQVERGSGIDPGGVAQRSLGAPSPALSSVELRTLQDVLLRHRTRILRKLAILVSSRGPVGETRPSSLGLRELLSRGRFEHRGSDVAWATELLRRDLASGGVRVGAIERGWFTPEDLWLPPLGPAPCELTRAPIDDGGHRSPAYLWFDRCVASMEPFAQDFLLSREYDGGSWHHISALMHRSVPACMRFHASAREALRCVVRRHSRQVRDSAGSAP